MCLYVCTCACVFTHPKPCVHCSSECSQKTASNNLGEENLANISNRTPHSEGVGRSEAMEEGGVGEGKDTTASTSEDKAAYVVLCVCV